MVTDRKSIAWLKPHALDAEARQELWRFVSRYEDIAPGPFEHTLRAQDTVIVCRHASGEVGGLVSWRAATPPGSERTFLWAEWGLLDPEFRGRSLIEQALLRALVAARCRRPLAPLFVMGEAATLKGYLMLARTFGTVWPSPGCPVPEAERPWVSRVIAHLGDAQWDAARGVFHRGKPIRLPPERVPARLSPLAEFYRRANPGQPEGDSLLCLVPVRWTSLPLIPLRSLWAACCR